MLLEIALYTWYRRTKQKKLSTDSDVDVVLDDEQRDEVPKPGNDAGQSHWKVM